MTEHEDGEIAVQPALLTPDLPDFEGLIPVGVITKVNGAGQRIHRAMHLEERIVLVIETEVSNVGHTMTDDGVKRIHTLKVKDLYELEGKTGASLLRSLRQAYTLADDARHGRQGLGMAELEQPEASGAGIDITVDDQGRIHTATTQDGGLGLPHVDVAVLVFEDESRALWPDDFKDATGPHPEAGERIRKPDAKAKDEPVLIRKVLDADTGEELEVWTDEQENDRLLEEEHALAVEEARQDRETVDELEAARARARAERGDPPLPGETSTEEPTSEQVIESAVLVLMQDPTSGTSRAIGSVKGDLKDVEDLAVIEGAIDYEMAGKNRGQMLAALEARASELRP